jgi:hypothetical protein
MATVKMLVNMARAGRGRAIEQQRREGKAANEGNCLYE